MTDFDTRPLVSLIITTYNDARFLADALDSAVKQSVRPDEIIVIDDGSTDDPSAIVERYSGVIYARQQNQGLAAARNTGLRMASGKFIAFLDADDRLRPNAIETNLELFRAHPDCGFVYGAYGYINEAGDFLHAVPIRSIGKDAFAGFLTGNLIGMHATVLYHRSRLEGATGFDQRLPACEDYDIYLRLSQRYPVVCTGTYLADYRRHRANLSGNIPLMLSSALKVLKQHEGAARRRGDWAAAYSKGVLGWKDYYAYQQSSNFIRAIRSRTAVMAELRNTARVARIAPLAMLTTLRVRFTKWRRTSRVRKQVQFCDLLRTSPFSENFGFDRGKPVDRRYVEAFLTTWSSDIRGQVLEVGDNTYTTRFGGSQVTRSDVLNRYGGNSSTSFVSDLSNGSGIPSDFFDCVVLTQTLHLVFDIQSAVATLWRILKPGGVLLITVPWVSPIDRGEWGESWYWSITPTCLKHLLSLHFAPHDIEIVHYGNVYSATGFLYGLAEHELQPQKLDIHDRYCPVIVAGRARKT